MTAMTPTWHHVLTGAYAVSAAIAAHYKETRRRTVIVKRQKHWRMTIVKAIAARTHGWQCVQMVLPKGMQVTI